VHRRYVSLVVGMLWTVVALSTMTACQSAGDEVEKSEISSPPSRHVALDGQTNFRDVGGYQTTDGRTVKWAQVYRSGELHKLSDEDLEVLANLEIQSVASFLTDEEITARGRDRLPPDTREVPLPIVSGNAEELTRIVNEARRTGDFSALPPEANADIHRLLVNEGRAEYGALIKDLVDPTNRPYVFHCSHGIHRTGTATAILLSALGVPWETVREDYLLSNEYRRQEVERRLEGLRKAAAETLGIRPSEVDMTNILAFYALDGSYIDAAYDEIVKEYGSMDNYLRAGLGLTEDDLVRLREELLD